MVAKNPVIVWFALVSEGSRGAMTNKKTIGESKGFWETLIGPNKEDVWQELSEQIYSKIEKRGWLESDKMHLEVRNWTITLDDYTVSNGKSSTKFTRMRAPFKSNSDFRFCMSPHGLISNIAIKLFGAQDIHINDEEFDKRFVIESNNEWKVRQLLESQNLRNLLLSQNVGLQFALMDDEGWFGTKFPDGVDELYFSALGTVRDIDVLRTMFALFTETLIQLERMGIASTEKPGLKF